MMASVMELSSSAALGVLRASAVFRIISDLSNAVGLA
jgi:phage portal protein BeeE